MVKVTYNKQLTALLVIDPYNDFISEGGKAWDRLKAVAEANSCVPHMVQVLHTARQAGARVFYALHHRYRPGDYETWKYIWGRPACAGKWSSSTSGPNLVSVEARGLEAAADWGSLKSRENSVGFERTENFASPGGAARNKRRIYAAPAPLSGGFRVHVRLIGAA